MPVHIAIDVETSDLSPQTGGRVIEVAAVIIRDFKIVQEFSTLIAAPCRMSRNAQEVHGISQDMLAEQPSPEKVWPLFSQFISNHPLIAHNARFDIGFIRYELGLLGLSLSNRTICTLTQSRRLLTHLSSHSLDTVARCLLGGIPENCTRHRALGDARLAALIWGEMGRLK
jgi:DNA polymerase-3 subunit epsilon